MVLSCTIEKKCVLLQLKLSILLNKRLPVRKSELLLITKNINLSDVEIQGKEQIQVSLIEGCSAYTT